MTNPTPVQVVSGASYKAAVAPGSLAAIFGRDMANATEAAVADSEGRLPTTLGGVSVAMNGKPVPLLFVSPGQINCVIPDDIEVGTANVAVTPSGAGAVSRGTVQVENTSPALLSRAGTGEGEGAILNSVTFTAGPFLAATAENPGDDKRTRLALFGSGIRFAGNPERDPLKVNAAPHVRAEGRTASGETLELPVEYAGPASGYAGLDQVNVVLPPEADGVGVVEVAVWAESSTSNIVTFTMSKLPPGALGVASLTLSNNVVVSGGDVTGTVSLNGRAPSSGLAVTLESSHVAAQVPGSVMVAAGEVRAEFTVRASSVAAAESATVSARSGGTTRTAGLRIEPAGSADIAGFNVTPGTVIGGRAVLARIDLSGQAGAGGVRVTLESGSATVTVPASVTVPTGQASLTVTLGTVRVTTSEKVTLRAATAQASQSFTLVVNPEIGVSVQPDSVLGGNMATGTVTLGEPAGGGGALVSLKSSSPAGQTLAAVNIPGGQSSATFEIRTTAVTSVQTVTITVTHGANSATATLRVRPATSSGIESVTLNPARVPAGASATGTVLLGGSAGISGLAVNLRSSSPMVQVPMTLQIAAGQSSGTFTVTTLSVAAGQTATITATAGAVSKSAQLTVY